MSRGAIGLAPGGVAKVFAPDGDGRVDKMRLTWTASETAIGRLRILRGARARCGRTVAGAGGSIDWNGRDRGGGRAPVGTYRVIVDARTADGRPARSAASTIPVRTAGFPRVSKAGARIRAYSVLIRTRASVRLRVVDEARANGPDGGRATHGVGGHAPLALERANGDRRACARRSLSVRPRRDDLGRPRDHRHRHHDAVGRIGNRQPD